MLDLLRGYTHNFGLNSLKVLADVCLHRMQNVANSVKVCEKVEKRTIGRWVSNSTPPYPIMLNFHRGETDEYLNAVMWKEVPGLLFFMTSTYLDEGYDKYKLKRIYVALMLSGSNQEFLESKIF